jgi:hypothetical protein
MNKTFDDMCLASEYNMIVRGHKEFNRVCMFIINYELLVIGIQFM